MERPYCSSDVSKNLVGLILGQSIKVLTALKYVIVIFVICIFATGCSAKEQTETKDNEFRSVNQATEAPKGYADIPYVSELPETPLPVEVPEIKEPTFLNPEGATIKERFLLPEGFERTESESGSFAEFLQNLPLKADGTKVKYFDGREKARAVYMAVVDYTLGDRDLQQCADAVMRLRAEYLYSINKFDSIKFNFVSGFCAEFSKQCQQVKELSEN